MADLTRKTDNLFDKDNPDIVEYYTNSTTGVYTYSQNTRSVIIPCQPNKTYSATKSVQGTAPRFSLSCYDKYPQENDIATARVVNNDAMQLTLTTTANSQYLVLFFYYLNPPNVSEIQQIMDTLMVNEGQPLPYEPYGWIHSLRKLTTATEAVGNPLYSDGTAITAYTIKGNEEHTGTPSSSNPITINGVGEKTANLTTVYSPNTSSSGGLNFEAIGDKLRIYGTTSTYVQCINTNDIILPSGTYTFSISSSIGNTGCYAQFRSVDGTTTYVTIMNTTTITFNEATTGRIRVVISATESTPYATDEVISIMINKGSTAQSYEPSGYKISIFSNGAALSPMYLSEQLMKIGDTVDSLVSTGTATYSIKKLVLSGQENWNIVQATNTYRYETTVLRDGMPLSTQMCTHFEFIGNTQEEGANGTFAGSTSSTAFRSFFFSNLTTLTDWKQYLADQYTAGTPVTVYYILATQTTETVTAPSIPTTEGANSIIVDTTVQPTEFTATWTGWHDASVKEKSANLLDYTTMSEGVDEAYLAADGSEVSASVWAISDYIPCDGTSFTINPIGGNEPSICLYDENKTYITGKAYMTGGANTKQSISITATSSAKYIRFTYRKSTASYPDDLSEIMLNEGTTALPYEPYWK